VTAARTLAAALAAATLAATPAPALGGDGPEPLRFEPRTDLAITGAAALLWIGSELAKDRLAPSTCRFCGTNALDARFREWAVVGDLGAARRTSDVLAFGALPAAIAAHQLLAARGAGGDLEDGLVDVVIVVQAAALAADLNQLVKLAVGRQRPFVRYGNWTDPDRAPEPDDNLSFYSGHSSLAFSLAAAAGTVSSLRGYRSTPWVWAGGMTVATGIAALRMAGDKHYFSDVLTGAAIGAAFGVAVPRLLHGRDGRRASGGAGTQVSVVPFPLGVHVRF
jgi:membrane-associated phospholipid phosphatase